MRNEQEIKAAIETLKRVLDAGKALPTTVATLYALEWVAEEVTVGTISLDVSLKATRGLFGVDPTLSAGRN